MDVVIMRHSDQPEGGKAKKKLASILNDKVMFHQIDHPGIPGHSYQFGSEAVDIYEKYNI